MIYLDSKLSSNIALEDLRSNDDGIDLMDLQVIFWCEIVDNFFGKGLRC